MTNEPESSGQGTITLARPRDRASQTDFLRELSLARRNIIVPSTSGVVDDADRVSSPAEPAVAATPDAAVGQSVEAPWTAAFTHATPEPAAPSLGLFDLMPVTTWPDATRAEDRPWVDDPTDTATQSDPDAGPTTRTLTGLFDTLPATTWPSLLPPTDETSDTSAEVDELLSESSWVLDRSDVAADVAADEPVVWAPTDVAGGEPVLWAPADVADVVADDQPVVWAPADITADVAADEPVVWARTEATDVVNAHVAADAEPIVWARTEAPDAVDRVIEVPDRPDVAPTADVRVPTEPATPRASMVMPAGRPPVVTSAAPVTVRCSGLVASRMARGRRHSVLSGVDLTVRSGEVAVVTGRSGSGKSTLLECLAGLHRIDAGTITVGEISLNDATDAQIADLRASTVGYVAQEPQLLADLSAIENIELPLLLSGWDVVEARSEADAAVALVRLQVPEHRTSELSAGERRRVAIARALVGEPAILWLDEASAAIDPETMAEIYDLIFELCHDGLTVVAVTHDPVLRSCANTTYELRDGSLHPVVS